MHSITRHVAVVAGLVLMLNVTPSLGQPVCAAPGCNPTESDANGNTASGSGALVNATTGSDNTASGTWALISNTTGDGNTATGANALATNTTGNYNTASGNLALNNSSTGFSNTATGAFALFRNSTGFSNTGTGVQALSNNTTGIYNTASGIVALDHNTTGNNNAASGAFALEGNTTGNLNTASGFQALRSNDAGANNTAIGAKALKKSLGTKNIGIGYQAGVTLTNGNNNIYIGNSGAGDESQTIRIGTAQAQTFIAGINGAIVSGTTVEIDTTTGQLGVVPSSARYKQDIAPIGTRSEKVLDLRPVTFVYKDDAKGTTHYGLIAEEVATVYPDLVTHTATGEVQTVKYQELIPMLLNELHRQRQEFQQTLQTQRQDFQQALQRQQQELAEMSVLRKEMAELRALAGQGRETASLAR